jgi:metal-dependent amidase/aminoacylase/carboxypeptidase family protein
LLRNTVTATIVRAGEKVNVVPSMVEVELDARALPGFTPADVIRELHAVIGDDVDLELVRHDPGPPEPDLALFDMLGDTLRELDPEAIPVPYMQPGVTDARYVVAQYDGAIASANRGLGWGSRGLAVTRRDRSTRLVAGGRRPRDRTRPQLEQWRHSRRRCDPALNRADHRAVSSAERLR